ncbi:hypothetical protein DFH06DRAFT_1477244 [Mycena polygramma]|nr:hypothetical protein DFH06DRAFT_1477244 [Mycena polygramma]
MRSSSESEVVGDARSDQRSTTSPPTSMEDEEDVQLVHSATVSLLGSEKGKGVHKRVDADSDGGEDEDEEEEEEGGEEEDFDFELEFLVPVGVASDTVIFSSDVSFARLFQRIADEMDVRTADMEIGYKFNSWPKTDLPRILNKPLHASRLFSAARSELHARSEARTKPKKDLQVIVVDLRVPADKDKSQKSTSKNAKAKKKKSTKRDDDSDDDEPKVDPGKKSPADILRELEGTLRCARHEQFCVWYVVSSFAEGVHESMSTPPDVLQLPMEDGTRAPAPSRRTQVAPQPPGPYPYAYPSAGPYPYPPPGPYPHAYYQPPPPPPLPEIPQPPPAPVHSQLNKTLSIESDDDNPTLYPKIEDWLLELDMSEQRGEDGHHFTQFGPALRKNGIVRVIQIANEGEKAAAIILGMCEGMPVGVARLLMRYAEKDCRRIRKEEEKRKADWNGPV